MKKLIIFLMLLLIPYTAHSAREIVEGFEIGEFGFNSTYEFIWSEVNGSPTHVNDATTTTNDTTSNDWSVEFSPASGGTEYIEFDVTDGFEYSTHFGFYMETEPDEERTIFEFYDSTGTQKQCFLTYEPDGNQIHLYFKDTDHECGASINDGTYCDIDAIEAETAEILDYCREVNPDEATCSAARFSSSQVLDLNTWYSVYVSMDSSQTGASDVECSLWINGTERGTEVRPQGVCSGGSDETDGDACGADSDCTGTCSTTQVGDVETVRYGTTDTVTSAADYHLDDVVLTNTVDSNIALLRIQDLRPNGLVAETWGTHNCGSPVEHHTCLDEIDGAATSDYNGTALNSPPDGAEEIFELTDITVISGESIQTDAGVSVVGLFRGNTSAANKDVRIGIQDGDGSPNKLWSGYVDLASHNPIVGDDYDPDIYTVFSTAPDSGSWTEAEIDALRGGMQYSNDAENNNNFRVSSFMVQVEISLDSPPNPTSLSDKNNDSGIITVCVAGDSKLNNDELYDALQAGLQQADNVYDCADGGDQLVDIVSDWENILNGSSSVCSVKKGTIGADCDYTFLEGGVNDVHTIPNLPRQGYCYGGANDGLACRTTNGYSSASNGVDNETMYCKDGTDFLNVCMSDSLGYVRSNDKGVCKSGSNDGTACQDNTDCTGGGFCNGDEQGKCIGGSEPTSVCEIDADCAGGGECSTCEGDTGKSVLSLTTCSHVSANSWDCLPGDIASATCPSGLCVEQTKNTTIHDRFKTLFDAVDVRNNDEDSTNNTKLILMLSSEPSEDRALGCWGQHNVDMGHNNSWLKQQAAARTYDYIDVKEEMYAKCDFNDYETCLKQNDAIHYSVETGMTKNLIGKPTTTTGNQVIADLIEDCLEEISNANTSCTNL